MVPVIASVCNIQEHHQSHHDHSVMLDDEFESPEMIFPSADLSEHAKTYKTAPILSGPRTRLVTILGTKRKNNMSDVGSDSLEHNRAPLHKPRSLAKKPAWAGSCESSASEIDCRLDSTSRALAYSFSFP